MIEVITVLALLLWLFLPLLGHQFIGSTRSALHPAFILAIQIATMFAVWLIPYWTMNAHYEREVWKYDVNRDGVLSDFEFTEEAEAASWRLTLDTGRQFYAFIGVPATIAWAAICFVVFQATGHFFVREGIPPESQSLF